MCLKKSGIRTRGQDQCGDASCSGIGKTIGRISPHLRLSQEGLSVRIQERCHRESGH